MKNLNLDKVQEATESIKLVAGGYVCGIVAVSDNEEKEYLDINFDIVEGDFKGYYKALNERFGDWWGGRLIRSYKEAALPFFKSFKTAVEKSNPGYTFKEEEFQKLKGKKVGLVLSEEEYEGKDGSIKTRLYVSAVHSVEAIKNGKFEVKPLKTLNNDTKYSATGKAETVKLEETDDDYPF